MAIFENVGDDVSTCRQGWQTRALDEHSGCAIRLIFPGRYVSGYREISAVSFPESEGSANQNDCQYLTLLCYLTAIAALLTLHRLGPCYGPLLVE